MKKCFNFFMFLVAAALNVTAQTYQVNGNAVNFGNGLVRLTSSTPPAPGVWQTSSAWCTTPINLTQPFDMSFDMFFGCESGPNGGDGITFTFQNASLSAIGGGGGFLGIGSPNISPSLSIEFDTYDGTPWGGLNEIPQDHIAIDINGNVNSTANTFLGTSGTTSVQPINGGRDLESCAFNANNYYTIRVVWNPVAKTLQLYEEGVLTMTYTNDVVNTIFGGNPVVYWGFTGATGDASNEQWIAPTGGIIPWECTAANSCCTPYTVSHTGPAIICNSPITIGVSGSYSQYKWSTGATTSSINITTPGFYIVSLVQNQAGNACPTTDTLTIGSAGSAARLSGGATVCNDGTTVPLTVTFTGASPWKLTYKNDGVNQASIGGINTSSYIIQGSAPHVYSLASVINNNGCFASISGVATVNTYPGLPIGHDACFTSPGTALLQVDNGGGTYNWYTTSIGGSILTTGTSYTTPVLSTATTFYVQNTSLASFTSKSVALLNKAAGNGADPNDMNTGGLPKADLQLPFSANASFTLSSVTLAINVVLPWASSKISVTIQDLTASTSTTKDTLITSALAAGIQDFVMPLNYNVLAGHNYQISYEGQTAAGALGGPIKGIMYWQLVSSSTYPINTNSELSITVPGAPNTRYPGMFNWIITTGSPASSCGRTPVNATPCVIVLPIHLLDFKVKEINGTAILDWSTASEQNNSFFEVLKSSDGKEFISIGRVEGNGSTSTISNYSFTDKNLGSGTTYYRLKQVDYNGAAHYTSIKMITILNLGEISLVPNPGNGQVKVQTNLVTDADIEISVFNEIGQTIYKSNEFISRGFYDKEIKLPTISVGVYFIQVTSGSQSKVLKYVKESN